MMNAGNSSSSSSPHPPLSTSNTHSRHMRSRQTQYRRPLQDHTIREHHHSRSYYGDRFIPDRSSMDFDMARYLLVDERKVKENEKDAPMSKQIYRKHLSEALMMNRTQILSFWRKPPRPNNEIFQEGLFDNLPANHVKPSRQFRSILQTPVRTLDAPDLMNDYYLNLLDWSNSNILAIALENSVYLWDASKGSSSELLSVDEESGPVTSVSWAPNGQDIAVGFNSSVVELWDATVNQKLRTLQGGHQGRVGSLSWNKHILTTGGIDCKVINNDVRVRSHIVQTFRGHHQEVCALKWSGTGQQLASGGNDRLLYIWDRSMALSNSPNQWFHRFNNHKAAVKALAWSPFQSNLLASGGGNRDHSIKFWNTHSGTCLQSIDTGSQVCSLLWSNNEKELLSSHALTENQLILWKYPSMVKIAELGGHTSRVLFMAQSPDGCTVASAGADERLCFWNVFGTPEVNKPKRKTNNSIPFSNWMSHIR